MSDQAVPRNVDDRTRRVYEAAIRLYNAGDMAGFAGACGQQAVLVTPAGTFRGGAAILAYWTRQHDAFPDLHLTVDLVVGSGDVVMSEWTWVGTNTGPLPLRDGTLAAATGRRVQLQGMEVARVRDGRIVEYHIYWDGIALAHQLGWPSSS
jgi:ketosteroid isomerase-like protein